MLYGNHLSKLTTELHTSKKSRNCHVPSVSFQFNLYLTLKFRNDKSLMVRYPHPYVIPTKSLNYFAKERMSQELLFKVEKIQISIHTSTI